MPRKGENIYKRKDGRWEGRYIKARSQTGKAVYGYVYAPTYKEVGDDMDLLIQEFNSVKERNFQLEFTYPDKSQRKNMRIIHRDMTQNELRDIRKSNSNLADITSKLANGEIRKEDLDEDTVNRLKDVLYN